MNAASLLARRVSRHRGFLAKNKAVSSGNKVELERNATSSGKALRWPIKSVCIPRKVKLYHHHFPELPNHVLEHHKHYIHCFGIWLKFKYVTWTSWIVAPCPSLFLVLSSRSAQFLRVTLRCLINTSLCCIIRSICEGDIFLKELTYKYRKSMSIAFAQT